jgi:hypothetical protein
MEDQVGMDLETMGTMTIDSVTLAPELVAAEVR